MLAFRRGDKQRSTQSQSRLTGQETLRLTTSSRGLPTKMTRYYNSKVRNRSFRVNEFVLKKVFQENGELGVGTLGPTWEGPYKIIEEVRFETYRLEDLEERETRHPWNVAHMRPYHQ
ncbi:Uncharacterized protein Adt_35322 [Abeliophyllum distichum]|uniref:Reverse transcriptase domain-containing protein n=1 Tax=Abeliophyllum distichum TaxID=126358 RepID=A0ABD1QEM6_9LAMI